MTTTSLALPLTGRTAVVTGASSGMGAASAERLAALGATVVLLARRADRLTDIVARIEANGGTALALPVDTTDTTAVQSAAERVQADFGGADLVFNNAGAMFATPIDDLASSAWRRQIEVNIDGLTNMVSAFVPQLVAAAERNGVADLINNSSVTSEQVVPLFPIYAGTKAFISHFSRNLRAELGGKKVRVSVIEPGLVDTEMVANQATEESARQFLEASRQHAKWLTADDIADLIAYLATLPPHVNLPRITVAPTGQPG
jgi:NADP-dependent 3-hydroxy acid dehydrogenase YdfG